MSAWGALLRPLVGAVALCALAQGSEADDTPKYTALDKMLGADWVEPDWASKLLAHVDQNLDPALPLVAPEGWRAALRRAVYDCWTNQEPGANAVRNYDNCFDSEAALSRRAHDLAWVLIRHEWEAYRGTLDPAQRRAAAWHLDQAIGEYQTLVTGAELRSVEPQGTSLRRLRVIRGFRDEIAVDLGADSPSDIVRRQQVRVEINRQLRLDGTGAGDLENVFESIAGPLKALTQDAMMTYLAAVEARLDAEALAVLVYGKGDGLASEDGGLSAYLFCNEAGNDAEPCALGSERSVLSLTALANRPEPEMRELYEFVRDAVLERPNAIGLSERYARMKQALYPGDPTQASMARADQVFLNWIDKDGLTTLSLDALYRSDDAMVDVSAEGDAEAARISLQSACEAWAAARPGSAELCPYRRLASRALPAAESQDTFDLRTRELATLSLLYRVQQRLEAEGNSDRNPALSALIKSLLRETAAIASGGTAKLPVTASAFALPYIADDRARDLTHFDVAMCQAYAADIFQAHRCTFADSPDGSDGATLLEDRLRRLINGEPPESFFNEKRKGLFVLLDAINEELVADGAFIPADPATPASTTANSVLIDQICKDAPVLLETLSAAGMREVTLAGNLGQIRGGGLCK